MEGKIKEILKKGAMSISDIRDNLGDVSRSQLIGLLNKMVDDEVILKKTLDDRSYYYLDGNDDKAFDINLEYNEAKKFENEKYSFNVPDSFKMVDDERDFVAFLPNGSGMDYENGGADIIVFASNYIPIPSSKIKRLIPEVRAALYEVIFWNVDGEMLETLDKDPVYELVDIGMEAGLITCKLGTQYNFYFICSLNDEYKQMRIVIEDSVGSFSNLKELAIKLMSGFATKSKLDNILALNDEKYMVSDLDSEITLEWISNIKDVDLNIRVLLDLISKSEKKRFEILKCDRSSLEKRLRERVSWVRYIFDRYLIQARDFILKVRENNSEDLLIPIYYNLNLFICNCGEVKIDLEGEIISEISSKVQDIYYEIFDEKILRMTQDYIPKEDVYKEDLSEKSNTEDYSDFIEQSKRNFDEICKDFNLFKDSYLDAIEGKTFNSEFALKLEINSIKKEALSYGDRFEDFLINFDKAVRDIDDEGIILEIKKIVKEVFYAFDNIHLDFFMDDLDMGKFDYDVSKQVLRIKDYWLGNEDVDEDISDLSSMLSLEVDTSEEKWKEESLEIQKLIDEKKNKTILKEMDKLDKEYNDSIEIINDKIRKLKEANLDITDKIDELSKINFRKKDKLHKEMESNTKDIRNLENELRLLKGNFDDKKEDLKKSFEIEDIVIPIRPKELLNKIDDLIETDETLKAYKINQEYMDDILEELTCISKKVTIFEMTELSDKLSKISEEKLFSLISELEKEGRVNKVIVNKKTYYFVNKDYAKNYRLNINLDYPFGKDIDKIYNILIDLGSVSFDNLIKMVCNLSKTRIMQVLYYLISENRIYIKNDSKIKVCLR